MDSQPRRGRRRTGEGRRAGLERLEPRVVLDANPVAVGDPFYSTAEDTPLVVDGQGTTLLDNDWDPEGSSLTVMVVESPGSGTLSNFSGSAGTFTYTPNFGFSGVDTFTYKVSDGTNDSDTVMVSIAVGGHFGPQRNLQERDQGGGLLTGALELAAPLTPGLALLYNSTTLPQPIVVIETSLQDDSDVPDEIKAQLTFDGSAGTTYTYDTTSLTAGDTLRFALQADATSLATGHYDYSVKLTADMLGDLVDHTFTGDLAVVNRGGATHAFGRGWQLAGIASVNGARSSRTSTSPPPSSIG